MKNRFLQFSKSELAILILMGEALDEKGELTTSGKLEMDAILTEVSYAIQASQYTDQNKNN